MPMVYFLRFCFLTFFLAFFSSSYAAASLTDMRAHNHKEKIQFVLELTQATAFSQFSLVDPPRIVIDLPNTQLKTRAGFAISQGSVERVRTGMRENNTLRVVLDLKESPRVNIYTLDKEKNKGFRIVVDIFKTSKMPVIKLESLNDVNKEAPLVLFAGKKLTGKQFEQDIRKEHKRVGQPKKTEVSKKGKVTSRRIFKLDKKDKQRDIIVVLDPGHGGKDPGAISKDGLMEKVVVLQIAKKTQQYINRLPGFKAYLTRNDDRFIKLRDRINIARKYSADLFVSIHADNFKPNPAARGSSVYILSTKGASSEAAKWLAESENAADLKSGLVIGQYADDVRGVLIDILQEATLESSHKVAKTTLQSMGKSVKLHKKNVERAGFLVLKAPDIPSILVETAFLSNPSEAKLLRTAQFQDKIARQIAEGIDRYFKEHLPQHLLEAGGR